LVIHISNLTPVVAALADDGKFVALVRDDAEPSKEDRGAQGSRIVVLAKTELALALLAKDARRRPLGASQRVVWTDDFRTSSTQCDEVEPRE
jgi:hypothetical protein